VEQCDGDLAERGVELVDDSLVSTCLIVEGGGSSTDTYLTRCVNLVAHFEHIKSRYSNCKIVGRGRKSKQDLLIIVTKSNVTFVGGEILSFTNDSIQLFF
jgi:hypothetical protein